MDFTQLFENQEFSDVQLLLTVRHGGHEVELLNSRGKAARASSQPMRGIQADIRAGIRASIRASIRANTSIPGIPGIRKSPRKNKVAYGQEQGQEGNRNIRELKLHRAILCQSSFFHSMYARWSSAPGVLSLSVDSLDEMDLVEDVLRCA